MKLLQGSYIRGRVYFLICELVSSINKKELAHLAKYGITAPMFDEINEDLEDYFVNARVVEKKIFVPKEDFILNRVFDENPLKIYALENAQLYATGNWHTECDLYIDGVRSDLTLICNLLLDDKQNIHVKFNNLEVM